MSEFFEEGGSGMPIYEYVCGKCGDHLEVIQKMSDKPLTRCAKCKGRLEKAISKSSFAFKGSGWYVTDYAKSGTSSDTPARADGSKKNDSAVKRSDDASGSASTTKDSASPKSESPASTAPASTAKSD